MSACIWLSYSPSLLPSLPTPTPPSLPVCMYCLQFDLLWCTGYCTTVNTPCTCRGLVVVMVVVGWGGNVGRATPEWPRTYTGVVNVHSGRLTEVCVWCGVCVVCVCVCARAPHACLNASCLFEHAPSASSAQPPPTSPSSLPPSPLPQAHNHHHLKKTKTKQNPTTKLVQFTSTPLHASRRPTQTVPLPPHQP